MDTRKITEFDAYLFGEGKHYEIYEKLGAHISSVDGVKGVYFAVWAPHAVSVSVVGNFNAWNTEANYMERIEGSGIYDLFVPELCEGELYKYFIRTSKGEGIYKADPYANYCQLRPETASIVADLDEYEWADNSYIERRVGIQREERLKEKMTIYELHLGSWKKKDAMTEDGFFNYREIAPILADYVCDMGYTHIELIGISEHPYDGSWGYQVTGYYAPTSRYGSPQDFMYFVDYMHNHGIGVILDWVPAHFPKDSYALARFDGEPLYEHPDTRRGEHPHWGTLIFNYGLNEVANFLIANAMFWLKKYHIDALRVDAVASMLYLDYGKNDGEWVANKYGGRDNLEAIEMLRRLSEAMEERIKGTYLIAEESTAWAGVTAPTGLGGLGFLYKWNMGWMNDFLEYMHLDPYFRQFNHGKLTFSMMYAYSENFIQVLSHDEVVHMKGSMINKMPGDDYSKFSNLRAAYGFMYGHPGKKLLFMGQEFAQYREWSEKRELDWFLLKEEKHLKLQNYVKVLNRLYGEYKEMYCEDCVSSGFEWISCDEAQKSLISFMRKGAEGRALLFVCNFIPNGYKEYRIGIPARAKIKELLNSDNLKFGGSSEYLNPKPKCEEIACNGREYSTVIKIAPLSATIFEIDYLK